MVPGRDELLQRPEHRLLGAGERQHVVRADPFVGGGDRVEQRLRAPGRRVGQRQALEGVALLGTAEREELADGQRLCVGCGQVVARRELPVAQVDLQAELGQGRRHGVSFSETRARIGGGSQAGTAAVTCGPPGLASSSATTMRNASTTAGSNWVPAQRRSSSIAWLMVRGAW